MRVTYRKYSLFFAYFRLKLAKTYRRTCLSKSTVKYERTNLEKSVSVQDNIEVLELYLVLVILFVKF